MIRPIKIDIDALAPAFEGLNDLVDLCVVSHHVHIGRHVVPGLFKPGADELVQARTAGISQLSRVSKFAPKYMDQA